MTDKGKVRRRNPRDPSDADNGFGSISARWLHVIHTQRRKSRLVCLVLVTRRPRTYNNRRKKKKNDNITKKKDNNDTGDL